MFDSGTILFDSSLDYSDDKKAVGYIVYRLPVY
jgi:hypothetical protein